VGDDVGCIVGSGVSSLVTAVGIAVLDPPIEAGETVGTPVLFLLDLLLLLDRFILLLPTVPFMLLLDFFLLLLLPLLLLLLFFDPLLLDGLGLSLRGKKCITSSGGIGCLLSLKFLKSKRTSSTE